MRSEALKRAQQKYSQKPSSKLRHRYVVARSAARGFIRKYATNADMDELEALIKAKRQQIADGTAPDETPEED